MDATSDRDSASERSATAETVFPDEHSIRTALVVVHGMGSQLPVETLDGFVKTALRPLNGETWKYYSRPAAITRSYEARRYIAFELRGNPPPQRHTDVFEYHWSYLMTGNRLGDVWATTLRVMLRRPSAVPSPLYGAWRLVWILAGILALLVVGTGAAFWHWHLHWPALVTALASGGILAAGVRFAVTHVGVAIAASFVDVTRYLDTSPRSYEARRAIRGGLVDLLRALHDDYDRVVVVAHSLGGYIAYDALTSLWGEFHTQRALPPTDGESALASLEALEQAAASLLAPLRKQQADPDRASRFHGDPKALADVDQTLDDIAGAAKPADPARVGEYQRLQFELWKNLRMQGNPWRITDFVTVGTPMYFADILVTRATPFSGFRGPDGRFESRALFGAMLRRGQLVRCPPRSETLVVDQTREPSEVSYGWWSGDRQLLRSQSVFGVVRWTNFWFPVDRGSLKGDWFGGPLMPLFGPGIRDQKVQGNYPQRCARAMAHVLYFRFEIDDSENSIAHLIRDALALNKYHEDLVDLATKAPKPDPGTAGPKVDRPH